MGYTIKIGELETFVEDGETFTSVYGAETLEKVNFCCGNSENRIDLTYSDFCTMAKILGGEFKKRFLDRDGWLNNNYPGYFEVTDKEIYFFEKTLTEYQSRTHKPTYAEAVGDGLCCFVGFNPDFMDDSYDWISDRLGWFIYWMKWSKTHFKNPVVHFS